MTVCQECGINIEIFKSHAPGCYLSDGEPQVLDDDEMYPDEVSEAWTAIIEVASERGTSLAKTVLRDSVYKSLDVDGPESMEALEDVLFDKQTMDIVGLCTWAGVMASLQVLIEQDFIDREAVSEYLLGGEDGTI